MKRYSYNQLQEGFHMAKKYVIMLLLALCLSILFLSSALADTVASGSCGEPDDPNATITGSCGDNVNWTLYESGLLTISGTGAMDNFSLGGAPWYSNIRTIQTVQIENGVTSIGNRAFYNCPSLTSVTIPSSVTSIGQGAFTACTSLTIDTFPSNITSIGHQAFSDCFSLTSMTIPSSVTSIGGGAFSGCSSLTSVTLPSSITSIEYQTFSGCTSMTSVTLPASVTSIGDFAFMGCTSMTSVTLPSSVTSIGGSAFSGCTSMTSVTIPASVTSIGDGAFLGCSSLVSIQVESGSTTYASVDGVLLDKAQTTIITCPAGKTGAYVIPASVTSIGNRVFSYCAGLESIQVESGSTAYASVDGVLLNKAQTALIACPVGKTGAYVIPDSVTNIGDYAFHSCASLTSVTIPSSVTSIGGSAFYNCSSLTDVYYIGSSGQWAEISISGGNYKLENAKIHYTRGSCGSCGENVTWTLDDSGLLTISGTGPMREGGVFQSSFPTNSVKTAVIEDGVTSIGFYAFCDCAALSSVSLPDSITRISNSAFKGCAALSNVSLPDGVTEIYPSAFEGCASLSSINIPDSVTFIGSFAFKGCASLGSITIPDGVTEIYSSAFESCASLDSITIPDGVTGIDYHAFYGCTGLANAYIPGSVTYIGTAAFPAGSNLTIYGEHHSAAQEFAVQNEISFSLTGNQPTEVGSGNCGENLTWTLYSDGVLYISGSGSMENYATVRQNGKTVSTAPWGTAPVRVFISGDMARIGNYAFYGCTNLTVINLMDIGRIGDYAFYGCTSLTSVELLSLWEIGRFAFYGCTSLNNLRLWGSTAKIGTNAFYGCTGLTSLVFSNMREIGMYAFSDCTNLTSVRFNGDPSGNLVTVGAYCFEGCSKLTDVTIDESVGDIKGGAFSNCASLSEIQLDFYDQQRFCFVDGVLFDGNMERLIVYLAGKTDTSYQIPDGVTSIDQGAFNGCANLSSITIPDSVTSINVSVFSNCAGLTSIQVDSGSSTYSAENGVLFDKEKTTLITYPEGKTGAYVIPDSVTGIAYWAFSYCSGLTSVTIPDSVTSIGYSAFVDCNNLTDVYYTGSSEQWAEISIGQENEPLNNAVIHYNYGTLILPASLTAIESEAFKDLSNVEAVSIPATVASIADDAFDAGIIIIAPAGSYAETWAENHGFTVKNP